MPPHDTGCDPNVTGGHGPSLPQPMFTPLKVQCPRLTLSHTLTRFTPTRPGSHQPPTPVIIYLTKCEPPPAELQSFLLGSWYGWGLSGDLVGSTGTSGNSGSKKFWLVVLLTWSIGQSPSASHTLVVSTSEGVRGTALGLPSRVLGWPEGREWGCDGSEQKQ